MSNSVDDKGKETKDTEHEAKAKALISYTQSDIFTISTEPT